MKGQKMWIAIVLILLVIASFCAGRYLTEQKHESARTERCQTLILFAIDKAENGDLADEGTMKALISNVYAAYQFCDHSISANQLHDLWNYLIFESENAADAKTVALQELNAVLHSLQSEA